MGTQNINGAKVPHEEEEIIEYPSEGRDSCYMCGGQGVVPSPRPNYDGTYIYDEVPCRNCDGEGWYYWR